MIVISAAPLVHDACLAQNRVEFWAVVFLDVQCDVQSWFWVACLLEGVAEVGGGHRFYKVCCASRSCDEFTRSLVEAHELAPTPLLLGSMHSSTVACHHC
jgi:hypothetical protein